jgi:hypothetical protein
MNWLILTYRPPSGPSAGKVYIWRKLKRLGAIGIFESVWVLPDTPWTLEQYQWLTGEILEMGGEAIFWKGQTELAGQEENLIQQFSQQVDPIYQDLLAQLEQPEPDLAHISQDFQQTQQRDYFHSSFGEQVRAGLLKIRGGQP